MDNLKEAGEAMAAHEDKMILETLHIPHLTMGSPAEDDMILQELMMPDDATSGEEEE